MYKATIRKKFQEFHQLRDMMIFPDREYMDHMSKLPKWQRPFPRAMHFLDQWMNNACEAVMQGQKTNKGNHVFVSSQWLVNNIVAEKKDEDDPGLSDVGFEMLSAFLKEQLGLPRTTKAGEQVAALQAKLVLQF